MMLKKREIYFYTIFRRFRKRQFLTNRPFSGSGEMLQAMLERRGVLPGLYAYKVEIFLTSLSELTIE